MQRKLSGPYGRMMARTATSDRRAEGKTVRCRICGGGGTLYKTDGGYICRKCREGEKYE